MPGAFFIPYLKARGGDAGNTGDLLYLAEQYLEEISEMELGLLTTLLGLELAHADPTILFDFDRLVQEQFNLEAFNDIFVTSYNLNQIHAQSEA